MNEAPAEVHERNDLIAHAKIYALAEKYLAPGLKAVALEHFEAAATTCFDMTKFLEATREVYASTHDNDRGLRDVIIEKFSKKPKWLAEEEVRDVLKEMGALTYNLVIYMHKYGSF